MKFSTVLAVLSAAAVVSAAPQLGAPTEGLCSTGTAQCCSSVKSGQDATKAADLLGLQDLVGAIGLGCEQIPIAAVIAASANVDNQCKQTPVCCTNDAHNGLVQVGCTPIPVN